MKPAGTAPLNQAEKNTPVKNPVTALVADARGKIFELEGYGAVGMAGKVLTPLTGDQMIPMPHGSELMMLPDRAPVLFNLERQRLETIHDNPFRPKEAIFPVAAFHSPGYMNAFTCAYEERASAGILPLFAYGAVGWQRNGFQSAVIRVDKERRQDLRLMPLEKVKTGVKQMRSQMPANRLRRHLEKCALTYGCPAAKNFFLGRFEAPLPTARQCNAGCLGCISLQKKETGVSSPQERIDFEPTPDEISEIAVRHIRRVRNGVVSFGQGCEGDPLLAADVIIPAIRQIRRITSAGTIHMNTNGSRTDILDRLFDAGLDSVRISINSFRPECYHAYFNPAGYGFENVMASIALAGKRGKFVSINYLNCPGVTDAPEEVRALLDCLDRHPVNMIQWRNLNYDPLRYWRMMDTAAHLGRPTGMRILLQTVQRRFPAVRHGYFNPPRENS
ncbi:MAG: radical SAM protein [Thermodesulfobacteriota bacterium]